MISGKISLGNTEWSMSIDGLKPNILTVKTNADFKKWYWLKEELVVYCKHLGISYTGGKFELQERISFVLENPGKPLPKSKPKKPSSKFNWAKEKLSLNTLITDTVSFGPNFRNFMKSQVGDHFYCHSDFMDWVNLNAGKTLADAVVAWNRFEKRKEDPGFKRVIRPHNMFNQYLRDFFEDNKGLTLKDAKKCWSGKKSEQNLDGKVIYETKDLSYLEI